MSYGLATWGQVAKTHLQKLLVLQKRALRLMYISDLKSGIPTRTNFNNSLKVPLKSVYSICYS